MKIVADSEKQEKLLAVGDGQAHRLTKRIEQGAMVSISQPLELSDGKLVIAAYSGDCDDPGGMIIHEQEDKIFRIISRLCELNTLGFVLHGLDAWLRFLLSKDCGDLDLSKFHCTRLLAYLLDPIEKIEDESERDLTLEALVRRYLGVEYPSWGVWIRNYAYPDGLYRRLMEDARFTYDLWRVLSHKLGPGGSDALRRLYVETELPMMRILVNMELAGVRVDMSRANQTFHDAEQTLAELKARIMDLLNGSWLNPNSPDEVRNFFSHLANEPYEAPITDDSFEEHFFLHDAVQLMLQYRKLSRDAWFLRDVIGSTGRLHPHYHQCRVATGRISCTNPGIQSIRREMRETYLLPESGHLLVEADYKQAEARLLAWLSGDERLCSILKDNERDMFTEIAEYYNKYTALWGMKALTRSDAKTLFYAVTYGASPERLSIALGIQREVAAPIVSSFKHELFPGVGQLIGKVREELLSWRRRAGRYMQTPWGRRRSFDRRLISVHDRNSPDSPRDYLRDPEIRRAFNFLLQGSVADLIKHVQVRLDAEFMNRDLDSRVVLNLHDGLYLSVPEAEFGTVQDIVRSAMEDGQFIETLKSYVGHDTGVRLEADITILKGPVP